MLNRGMALAAAVGISTAMFATPSYAVFVIDDYNTTNLYSVTDNSAANGAESLATGIDASNVVWGALGGGAGATRTIFADLGAGDSLTANVCNNCQVGEHVSANNSIGDTAFAYTGDSVDVSSEDFVMLTYEGDLAGASITITFDDAVAGTGSVSTGVLGTSASIMLALPGGVDYSQLTGARVDITGVTELDGEIDNFKLTDAPEPATLGLLAAGLLGLGAARRRRR